MSGIVVENKYTGMRYAISEENLDPKMEKKVRDLKVGETVFGFNPRHKTPLSELNPEPDVQVPDVAKVAEGSNEKGK